MATGHPVAAGRPAAAILPAVAVTDRPAVAVDRLPAAAALQVVGVPQVDRRAHRQVAHRQAVVVMDRQAHHQLVVVTDRPVHRQAAVVTHRLVAHRQEVVAMDRQAHRQAAVATDRQVHRQAAALPAGGLEHLPAAGVMALLPAGLPVGDLPVVNRRVPRSSVASCRQRTTGPNRWVGGMHSRSTP